MAAVQELSEPEATEGKYRVLVELGQGGTANVYLAVAHGPNGFNKLVVLKALKRNLGNDPEFRAMFLNEARLAARLNHPNIVQTNEVAEYQGLPMIVMEYLQGQPLSNLLVRGRGRGLSLAMHLRIVAEALQGLHCAHELADFDGTPLGVVHRDMTPHNIFVTFDGTVKVLDFGIAKLSTSLIETQAGIIKGKVRYMSPEQIAGKTIDRRADIYAVGVMLWEAATGERLWKGHSDVTIMNRVLKGEIPWPHERRSEVPEELERICMKALSCDRDQRYSTAAELELDLDLFLQQLGDDARVTNRQIGKLVHQLFEDVRLKTKAIVDAQLSRVASLSWAEYQAAQMLAHAPTITLSTSAVGPAIISDSIEEITLPRSKTVAWLPWIGGAAAMMAFLLAWKFAVKQPADGVDAMAPQGVAARPDTPSENRPPEKVSIKLSASPGEAKLYFDNEQLSSNPFSRIMAADGTQHTIRAEAQGYTTTSAAIVLDRDADIALKLERSKAPAKETKEAAPAPAPARAGSSRTSAARPSSPSPAAAPAQQQAAPSPAAAKADCNPPYFVDARGIKRYRAECM